MMAPGNDPDAMLDEISKLSRTDVFSPRGHRELAHVVNQLIDWVGNGSPLPARLKHAQRVGPGARPIVQYLVLAGGIWQCAGCDAKLTNGKIAHGFTCEQVKP